MRNSRALFIPLLQQRGLVSVQNINNITKLVDCRQGRIVGLIAVRLVVNNQATRTLVQDTDNDLVQNHLRQLALDLLGVEANHLGNVINLDAGKGLNDLDEVLLQHGVVEAAEMVADKGVAAELVAVRGEGALVLFQGAVAVGTGNGLHGLEVLAGVLDGLLRCHELVHVIDEVEHNLAEQHVLQRRLGLVALVLGVVAVQGLDKVGKCRVEISVLGVQHAALHVEVGLQQRGCVDAGCARAGAGEGGAGLGDVAEGVVDAGLEELDLDQTQLVVEALQFAEQAVDECECFVV